MRKILVKISSIILLLVCSLGISGCFTISTPESLELDTSGVVLTYQIGAEVDFSGLKAVVTFVGGKTKELNYRNLVIGSVSTNEPGEITVTVTYLNIIATFTITVTEEEVEIVHIQQYSNPQFITDYNQNKGVKPNKENEFVIKNNVYLVGDDNEFRYMPVVSTFDEETQTLTVLSTYPSVVEVQFKDTLEGTYSDVLTGTDLTEFVTIDNTKGKFDFTENAIGKFFKVTQKVAPENEDDGMDPVFFEFKVVDGLNVYGVEELNLVSNTKNFTYQLWSEYRLANNISSDTNTYPSKFIFQRDVQILMDHFGPNAYDSQHPGYLDMTDPAPGALDVVSARRGIFIREMQVDEEFEIHGNYFELNASDIAQVYVPESVLDKLDWIYHSHIFAFEQVDESNNFVNIDGYVDADGNLDPDYKDSSILVEGLRIVGNAPRQNNADYFGGLFALRTFSGANDVVIDNVISHSMLTFAEFAKSNTHIIKNTKIYDNFATAISYFTASDQNYIINTEIKRSGGPSLMVSTRDKATYVSTVNGSESIVVGSTIVHVDNNSTIENYVTGQETWFTALGAGDLVTNLAGINQVVMGVTNALGSPKTYLINQDGINKMNMTNVFTVSDDLLNPAYLPQGGIRYVNYVNGEVDQITFELDTTSENLIAPLNSGTGMPIFIGPDNQYLLCNPNDGSLYVITESGLAPASPLDLMATFGADQLIIGLPVKVDRFIYVVMELTPLQ